MAGETSECSIEATLGVIGDRWSLLILRDVFRGTHRFSALQAELGIAKNLLAERLNRLLDAEILERVQYQKRPARFEYRLTPKGADLSASLIALMKWGDRWYNSGHPPTVLVHSECATPLELNVTCPACDHAVGPGHIRNSALMAVQGGV